MTLAHGSFEFVDGRLVKPAELAATFGHHLRNGVSDPTSPEFGDAIHGQLFVALGLDEDDYEAADDLPSWSELLDIARKHAARPVAPDPFDIRVINEGKVLMLVDGEPKPVEVRDGKVRVSSDAPWLVADDAININTAARWPTDPDVDVVGQVASAAMGFTGGAVRAAIHSSEHGDRPAPRFASVNADGSVDLTIRAADEWRVEVDESVGPSRVVLTKDAPRSASGDILTENDVGFPVSPLLHAVDRAMRGNTYRLLDGQSSADAVAGLAATLAAAQPIIDSILGKGRELNEDTMREAAGELARANEAFAKLVADERKRVEASMVDEPKVTYPRLAPDWPSLVPEGWGPSGVKMDTGEPVYRVFASHQQWVNKASGWMGSCDECVDSSGRVLRIGSDFERATWPVAIIRPVASGSPARPYDAVNIDLGAITAALAPGEALDLAGIIARAAAYRRHSIELAAIRAAVDPTVHTEVAGLVPFPWDAVEVGDPHDRVCVLVDAMNKAADALAKVRAS